MRSAAISLSVASAMALTAGLQVQVPAEQTDDIERRLAHASARVDDLSNGLRRTGVKFGDARRTFEEAARKYESAATLFDATTSDYQLAARLNRLAGATVMTAAGVRMLRAKICPGAMSTAKYRELHRLGAGTDVDHRLPQSLGGADNSLNYEPLPSSLNRSMGNDVGEKLLRDPTGFARGVIASAFVGLGGCLLD